MRTAYVENRFEYRGFPCVVIFQDLCHRCGYVGLPRGNKYYGKNYDKIDIECHGSITYSENELFGQSDKGVWWIGFDCAHLGDEPDLEAARKYFDGNVDAMQYVNYKERFRRKHKSCGEIRTQEFVENECRKIVDQLIEGDDRNEQKHRTETLPVLRG